MRGHTPTGDLLRFAFSITAHHVRGAVISLAPAGISSLGLFESENTKIHRALVKVCAYLPTRIPIPPRGGDTECGESTPRRTFE